MTMIAALEALEKQTVEEHVTSDRYYPAMVGRLRGLLEAFELLNTKEAEPLIELINRAVETRRGS